MTHNQNTMHRHFQQLQSFERGQIMAWLSAGWSYRQIARKLGRNVSTISREVKRGTTTQFGSNHRSFTTYFAETGQAVREKHRTSCRHIGFLERAPEFFDQLVKELKRKPRIHSVDSFVHWFGAHYPQLPCPSTPTVYRYIDDGQLALTNTNLPLKLRRRIKRPGKGHKRMNKRVLGQSIEERPAGAEKRSELGHWEGDLVKGKRVASEPAIMTLTERVSRYEIIVKIDNYHAATCRAALQGIVNDYGAEHFKSITFDNGSEFSELNQVKETQVYFAHPYSPWERGSNENQNQLIREFLPKGQSLRSLTLVGVQSIQDTLNQRPRKSLGYRCASEILSCFD